jgi:hypothetical protein
MSLSTYDQFSIALTFDEIGKYFKQDQKNLSNCLWVINKTVFTLVTWNWCDGY